MSNSDLQFEKEDRGSSNCMGSRIIKSADTVFLKTEVFRQKMFLTEHFQADHVSRPTSLDTKGRWTSIVF